MLNLAPVTCDIFIRHQDDVARRFHLPPSPLERRVVLSRQAGLESTLGADWRCTLLTILRLFFLFLKLYSSAVNVMPSLAVSLGKWCSGATAYTFFFSDCSRHLTLDHDIPCSPFLSHTHTHPFFCCLMTPGKQSDEAGIQPSCPQEGTF